MSTVEDVCQINLGKGELVRFFRNEDEPDTFHITGGMIICLCTGYEGSISIDRKTYVVRPGNMIILPENHLISFTNPVTEDSMLCISVTTNYILDMPSPIDTNIFSYSRYIPVLSVSESKYDDFLNYFRFLHKESREKSIYQEEIIRSILYALILEISGEYEAQYNIRNGAAIKSDDLSDRFFHLLAVYYREQRLVSFYADRLSITPKYLSTAIKKSTGRPVLEWIHEAVLIEAKVLLITSGQTVQEISERLNFSSPSAFVQFFKKHTGKTPKKL
ncbi:MAG: AraC family transcriptional regulator [Bacteroidales bacterium]|nr:AraC family transcriptional regulator [Bacteroidales bacterium]